mmetsp:Transcript_56978/g.180277  ORF Transcript_56978/g.180277 Transcript_56978/m.180277 type:complete len:262 (-) Transcript_56978:312-1097(-)
MPEVGGHQTQGLEEAHLEGGGELLELGVAEAHPAERPEVVGHERERGGAVLDGVAVAAQEKQARGALVVALRVVRLGLDDPGEDVDGAVEGPALQLPPRHEDAALRHHHVHRVVPRVPEERPHRRLHRLVERLAFHQEGFLEPGQGAPVPQLLEHVRRRHPLRHGLPVHHAPRGLHQDLRGGGQLRNQQVAQIAESGGLGVVLRGGRDAQLAPQELDGLPPLSQVDGVHGLLFHLPCLPLHQDLPAVGVGSESGRVPLGNV